MSIYDKSSLVLIPSGTKTSKVYSQKPTNGDGDFTFSRSTAATRVNASGNIEKETSNLLLQSNQFDTTWATYDTSVTSGQSGYDGTNDAWLLAITGATGFQTLRQSISNSGAQTFSIYAKAGALNWMRINTGVSNTYFDIANGAIGSDSSIGASIESAGNGYYRCSVPLNGSITFIFIYPAFDNNNPNQTSGNIYIQDAQLEQGLVARDYQETTTAAVYGGITDNTPRLDYTDSSCPALLLEPQRTNLVPHSEYFNSWIIQSGTSVFSNTTETLSPEGLYNAAKVTSNGANGLFPSAVAGGGGVNTKSIYLKGVNGGESVYIKDPYETITSKLCVLTTEWQRFEMTETQTNQMSIWISNIPSGGIYMWGAQLEQNASYATSYIPTYGSSVSRVADSCVKTGISDLIGQTEGTLFMDVDLYARDSYSYFALAPNLGSTSVYIGIGITATAFSFEVVNSGVQVAYNYSNSSTGNFKLAFAYKANDFVAYVNGTQVMTYTSGSVPACSQIALHQYDKDQPFLYKQALVFKTRLTNAELADLTTL
jgi:hypothetical protein